MHVNLVSSVIDRLLGMFPVERGFIDVKNLRPPMWNYEPMLGKKIINHKFEFYSRSMSFTDEVKWNAFDYGEKWLGSLHGFEWIGNIIRFNSGRLGSAHVAGLINDWIINEESHADFSFSKKIMAQRVYHWIIYAKFILANTQRNFRQRFYRSLSWQLSELSEYAKKPDEKISIDLVKTLLAAECYINGHEDIGLASKIFKKAIAASFYADMSIRNGNPLEQFLQFRNLIDLREMLITNRHIEFGNIDDICRKTLPPTLFFLHGDGQIALFNGAIKYDTNLILQLAEYFDATVSIPDSLESGYARISSDRFIAIMDIAPPRGDGFNGALSTEISSGITKIITNCGAYFGADKTWKRTAKKSATHSSLTINYTDAWMTKNSLDDNKDGKISATKTADLFPINNVQSDVDMAVKYEISNDNSRHFIRARHAGFLSSHNINFFRDIKIDNIQGSVTCIDVIEKQCDDSSNKRRSKKDIGYLHFHINPEVKIELFSNYASLTNKSGIKWKMIFDGDGKLNIEESAFLGNGGIPKKAQQILYSFPIDSNSHRVHWELIPQEPSK